MTEPVSDALSACLLIQAGAAALYDGAVQPRDAILNSDWLRSTSNPPCQTVADQAHACPRRQPEPPVGAVLELPQRSLNVLDDYRP